MTALAALLAPLDVPTFFAQSWEREPLHLKAEGRRAPVLTLEALSAALSGLEDPPEGLLAFPEHLGRVLTTRDLLRDEELYRAYLDAGHPLVWNRARGVWPEVDALSAALGEALGAHVWPNVYATGAAGTPFEMHFDCHEVLALHCEGRKEWQISAVRVDRPLDAAEMEPAVRAAMRARRDEAAGRLLLSFSVEPGDVVYIPRGQFHNARTPEGRSLHVTFGIQQLSGFDVVKLLSQSVLGDPSFREFFPPAAADPGGERAAAQLAEIVARARALLGGEGFAAEVAEARAHLVRRS
jgi:hypothetical protein